MDEMQKLRQAQLMIANEIKRICDKYQIAYFLDAGSLLGAVRHNGFIPWDDDIDIGMCKRDYERFIEVAPEELEERFFLDNEYTNSQNPYVFSKVRLKGTTYIEKIGNEGFRHNEIFVDVFPYYYISDNLLVRKIEGTEMAILSQIIMSKAGYKVWKGQGLKKRLKFIPTDLLGAVCSAAFLRKQVHRLYTKHDHTEMLCVHAGSCYGYWFFPEKILTELEEHIFENTYFTIPKNYDYFLTKAYGDYMTLPPKEKQITHQIQKLDFGAYNSRLGL